MSKICEHVPEYLPEKKPARVVMYGDFGIPCGGTHVRNIGEIEGIYTQNQTKKGRDKSVIPNLLKCSSYVVQLCLTSL